MKKHILIITKNVNPNPKNSDVFFAINHTSKRNINAENMVGHKGKVIL